MEPFKNNFSPELVSTIGEHLQKHHPTFDREAFETPILEQLEKLELKQRWQLITDNLHIALPEDNKQRGRILRDIMHPDTETKTSDERGISGWGTLPLTTLVGQYGLSDFDGSMQLLLEILN